jgi:replicative DNA helicase
MSMARKGRKLGLVVIDYLQLILAPRGGMKREQEVAENVRIVRAMAVDLDVCVLGLAQLNRECDKRDDHRPKLSDLRESGECEQAARTVLLLHRDDYFAKEEDPPTHIAEVHIAKQNNGPSGARLRLHFDDTCVTFNNLAEEP